MKKKTTEKICKDCKYCLVEMNVAANQYKCSACKKETVDHVTGNTNTIYLYCKDVNKDGKCTLYEEKPHIELRNALLEFQKVDERCQPDCFMRTQILGVLVDDILRVLDGKNSLYFTYISRDDTPYGVEPTLSKEAIEEALSKYEDNVDESENPLYDGCYVGKRTPEEIKKERSWIRRMFRAIGNRENE